MKENVIRVSKKPKKCTNCGSSKIAYYTYGMPSMSEKQQQQLKEGKIVLGGCCIGIDDPFCVCVDCETKFYKPIPEGGFPPPVEIKGKFNN